MKTTSLQSALLACTLLACGLAPAAQDERISSGPVALSPPLLNGLSDPVLQLPGREFKSGDGWWSLACAGAACRIGAASLTVTPHALGQALRWLPAPAAGTLLMFKPFRAPANAIRLVAGPVKTYYPGARASKAAADWSVALPDGVSMRLHPMSPKDRGGAPQALELRIGALRQLLPPLGFNGEYAQHAGDHVVWVGDLDGDGKPDLIVKTDESPGDDFVLLLSSFAKPGQLVGEAGRFKYFPADYPG
ncbi:hypothetical protein AAKU55_004563 [Oxalobacteraceae bacterium GrIS 1.11]